MACGRVPCRSASRAELAYLFLATDRDAFGDLSYPEYQDIRDRTKTLAGLTVTQRRGPTLTGDGFAESTMSTWSVRITSQSWA